MKRTAEPITIEKGGFIRLPQELLTRLKVDVGDYLNVEDAGDRCLRVTKSESPEPDLAITLR
jgi:antitoxin component of MazEF toxin-antitoxin module